MIRLIQRRLIIPRGDTGTFSIPVLAGKDTGDASILTIFDPLTHRKLREKRMELSDGVLTVNFTHGDTVNLPVGQYVWDIKFYSNPVFADDQIIDGEEVDSYYAAFTLPVCEIRETGDNLLMDDDAPQAKLAPGQIDLITAAITEIQAAKEAAASSAAEADTSATNAETSASAAAVSAQAAQNSEVAAATSQTGAAASASHAANSASSAQEAAARAAEIAAQIHEEIPTKVSDLIDDSGHYTKPAGGIPANDIADGVIPILTDLIDDTAGGGDTDKVWSADKITDTFDGLGQDFSHILTVLSSEIQAVNTVAQSKYTKPANGIPAADLEETYLTSFTETDPTVPSWAKQAQKPTYTAQEVGAPTIQQMNTALDEKAEKLTINLTLGEEETITCDTLIEDIKTAYEDGKIIEGILTRDDSSGINLVMKTIGMVFDLDPVIFMIEFIFDLGPTSKIRITGGINPGSLTEWQFEQDYVMGASGNTDYNAQSKKITYLAAPTSNTDAANKQYVDTAVSGKANSADLAVVATSGSYTDLSNKPFIPSAVSDLTDDSGHYTKPANGIPATDMTSGVQTSLGLADTAYQKPNNGIPASDLASGVIPSVPVQDVQIKNTSILNNGVANIPLAANGAVGLVQGNNTYGTAITAAGDIMIYRADDSAIKNGNGEYKPIVPYTEHQAVFYGLAKAAGDTTQRESQNSVGVYTSSAQSAIQAMLDVPSTSSVASSIASAVGNVHSFDIQVVQALPSQDIQEHTVYFVPKTGETNDVYDEYIYVNNAWEMIGNTQIDLSNYVQKTNWAESSTGGIVKTGDGTQGLIMLPSHVLSTCPASSTLIKTAGAAFRPIVPTTQHESTFYGLAKAAGDTTQSQSNNTVGTYTAGAKTAIQTMLDVPSKADVQNLISISTSAPQGEDAKIWIDTDDSTTVQVPTVAEMNAALAGKANVADIPEVPVQDVQINGTSIVSSGIANIPVANGGNQFGVTKVLNGYSIGIAYDSSISNGTLRINPATSNDIKIGNAIYVPITTIRQHEAAFYGLAKAAGDTSQSISTNAVGTYTDSAKIAIKNMLGVTQTLTVTVLTQDNVTVTNQTVTLREGGPTGQVYATATYSGQPVSFALPTGFSYYVSVSDTLAHHFNPTTASGIITDADAAATLTYSDFSSIQTAADIKAALNAGLDLTDLVGEQISCMWNNSTLVWDVVDYSNDTITLLTHGTLPTQLVFEPTQALMWCENGLAAGSYSFIDGSSTYYFTLTTSIPSGGQLRATTSAFQTYASTEATATLETGTVSTTEISGATSLGTTASGNLNHMSRVNYGSNNYKESALFQWLNSTEAANTPMPRITKFSRPCTYSVPGFLGALDSSFVAAIDNTTWLCSTNNTYECPTSLGGTVAKSNAYTVTAKVGLASEMEIFGSYGGTADGSAVFDLFNGATADDRKKYQSGTSTARYWWLRSPYGGSAHYERSVTSYGTAYSGNACSSYGVVPAVKISKTVVSE